MPPDLSQFSDPVRKVYLLAIQRRYTHWCGRMRHSSIPQTGRISTWEYCCRLQRFLSGDDPTDRYLVEDELDEWLGEPDDE